MSLNGGPEGCARPILSAHQPTYLPWLGLFHKIALADTFVLLDGVQFEKNSYTNRNRVKGPNGPVWLTVPVSLSGHMTSTIRDVRVASNTRWQKKHWKSMEQAYSKAPHFASHASFFEEIYAREWEWLWELNWVVLEYLLQALGIATPVVHQADISVSGAGEDLILDLCRQFGAKIFMFGALGERYVTPGKFAAAGVEARFQTYRHPEYPQLHGPFESHLSVVDLLFNAGSGALELILSGNVGRSELLGHQAP
jgi:hypothetical protein